MKYLYDLTDLVNHSRFSLRVTGIQRVVLEIGKALRNKKKDVEFFFLSPFSDKAYSVKNFDISKCDDLTVFQEMYRFSLIHSDKAVLAEKLVEYASRSRRRFFPKLLRFYSKLMGTPFLGNFLAHLLRKALIKRFRLNRDYDVEIYESNLKSLDDRAFVICGGVWNFQKSYENLILNNPKSQVIYYLHDIIPLVVPELVPVFLNSVFKPYVRFINKTANLIITSAKNNVVDYQQYIRKLSNENIRSYPIKAMGLPYGFDQHFKPEDVVHFRPYVKKLRFFDFCLAVGSIEPRKNHLGLLNAWRTYVNSSSYNGELLVIAGGWGIEVDDIHHILGATGNLGGSVVLIERPSDQELSYLYEKCHFTVYPSHYEGWGLPIGESLYFGKPVVHFNNSALCEVSRGVGVVLNPNDYTGLVSEIDRLFHDEGYFEEIKKSVENVQKTLPNWRELAADIIEEIDNAVS